MLVCLVLFLFGLALFDLYGVRVVAVGVMCVVFVLFVCGVCVVRLCL